MSTESAQETTTYHGGRLVARRLHLPRVRRRGPERQAPAPTHAISEANLRRLYDTYLVARQRTGESTVGLSYDSLASRIRAQVPELMQKHRAKNIEFKVVIKGGKAILKVVPQT